MKALGYVRVSTDQQAEQGVSLAAQEAKVRAMAQVHDAELVDVLCDDGYSAKSLDRPGMRKLLSMVERREVESVIVAKLDRLTRSVRDLGELLETFNKRGVALVSVNESLDTSSASGRLVLHIMGAVSEWERATIGERTREALQHKRSQNQRVGTLPYGFTLADDGVHLRGCPAEQEVLRIIHRLRSEGLTLQRIADELNQRGLTTRRGSPWQFTYVAAMLKKGNNEDNHRAK